MTEATSCAPAKSTPSSSVHPPAVSEGIFYTIITTNMIDEESVEIQLKFL